MRSLAAFTVLCLAASATLGAQATIDPGMSKAQVIAKLGPPSAQRSSATATYLYYKNGLEKTVGMSDLVTSNPGEYEDLILSLARDPAMLQDLRDRLQRNKATCPLFDSDLYRRNLEAAYLRMWEAWQRGEAPASFAVKSAVSPQSSSPSPSHSSWCLPSQACLRSSSARFGTACWFSSASYQSSGPT